jgi:hypothetical protein
MLIYFVRTIIIALIQLFMKDFLKYFSLITIWLKVKKFYPQSLALDYYAIFIIAFILNLIC